MKKASVCLVMAATVWSLGCGTQTTTSTASVSKGGIAVVDLDRVANETGKGTEMSDALRDQKESLQQAFSAQQTKARSLLEDKARDLNVDVNDLKHAAPEAQQELQKANNNLVSQLQTIQTNASRSLSNYQQSLLAKFRAELKPILQETATKRGLGVVVPKNDGLLLSIDPAVDITDDVIKAYNAKQPSLNAAQAAKQAQQPAASKPAMKTEKSRPSTSKKEKGGTVDGEESQS